MATQEGDVKDSKKRERKKWYIGAMNDALFIINFPPRPAPVDYLVSLNNNTVDPDIFIAGPFVLNEKGMKTISLIVEEHNRLLVISDVR